jgi:hypothetical protein
MAKNLTIRPSSDAREFVRESTASMSVASNGTAGSCNLAAQTANRVFLIDQPTPLLPCQRRVMRSTPSSTTSLPARV